MNLPLQRYFENFYFNGGSHYTVLKKLETKNAHTIVKFNFAFNGTKVNSMYKKFIKRQKYPSIIIE